MKKIIILSLLSGLFLVGCGSNNDKKNESASSTTAENSIDRKASEKKSKQKNIDIAVNSLKKGFSAYHDVSFDEKTKSFILNPKEGLSETETLKKVADNPVEPKYEETLKGMASNFIELSTTISEKVGKDYKIKLKYPGDNNKDIFVIQDGNISYPIIDEFKNKKSSSNDESSNSAEVQSEEEASKAAVQAQFEEDQRKADEFNAKLQADVDAENARVEAEVQAAQKAEQDRVNAENQRLAEQDKANGY